MTTLGYTIFYVADVGVTLQFYVDAFGFTQRFVTPENDYGELETGSTTLAFVSYGSAEANLGAAGGFTRIDPTAPPVGATITLITDDVAAGVASALGCGATLVVDVTTKPWGQTVAYVRDRAGILVEIATPVAEA